MLHGRALAPFARPLAHLIALALTLWLLLALVPPAAAQTQLPATPTPSITITPVATPPANPTPAPGGPAWPPAGFDPFALLGEQIQRALAELLATVLRPLRDAFREQLDRQANILTITRPEHTVGLPQVQLLHGVARAIANGALALILMVGGYNLIFRRHLIPTCDQKRAVVGWSSRLEKEERDG